ncbi:MAG: phenylalanine-4-hydroxylase [Pyrinomonadaceae bacterium]|nr:phenylalanine-4-hydroxylase [Pyrinomonadaceae bacterium]
MLQEQQRQLSNTSLPDITAHGDAACPTLSNGRRALVELDPDHPGFRDLAYRARRDEIAEIALHYEPGAPVPDAPYTDEEHQLWRTVRDALAPRHESHACAEYLTCVRQINLSREHIPQLREVSEKVRAFSGFRLEPVGGLVAPRVFLESLANGVFLSTQYIRHHSTPLYTPEPDVVHELLGHAVLLASEPVAELNRLVGEAVRRTTSDEALERLARVYWFTIEFGIVREAGEVKAYGAGLVSSAGELEAMRRAELRPLDLEAASRQEFDTTDYQPVLFCADSFESMFENLRDYLLRWP